MSINSQSNVEANLSIGPTTLGMVRIYIEGKNISIPLDFDPEEALEIAEELKAASLIAKGMDKKKNKSLKYKNGRLWLYGKHLKRILAVLPFS